MHKLTVRFKHQLTTAEIGVEFLGSDGNSTDKHKPQTVYVLDKEPDGDEMLRLRSHLSKFAELPFACWWPSADGVAKLDQALAKYKAAWGAGNCVGTLHKVGHIGNLSTSKGRLAMDSPELFTFPGMRSLKPVLDALDNARRRYRLAMLHKGKTELDKRREKVNQAAAALWNVYAEARSNPGRMKTIRKDAAAETLKFKQAVHDQGLSVPELDLGAIPRVLILGESGSGKTLVANYLATRADPLRNDRQSRPMKRLALPSYLAAEDRFEWDLFGYLPGAYTGGREEGSLGSALELVGGLLFLDEIGEASAVLQAKMLAFMDDFEVTPRGWEGQGFTCPMLLIAATNRDVRKWAQEGLDGAESSGFRHDLYWRFDTVIDLPGLNQRKETEMVAIVDSMLQLNAINPAGKAIARYHQDVIDKLKAVDYRNSNFRLLARLLKDAVKRAQSLNRTDLLGEDIPTDQISPTV